MTNEEKAILAHVVVDADAWYAHVVQEFGTEKAEIMLAAKVGRWRPVYETAKAAEGAAYKNRAVRDAEERAANEARFERDIAKSRQREDDLVARIKDQVIAEVGSAPRART